MTKKLMVLGTTSNAGKSVIVAALCRIYKRRGYKVAPFKSQNMALNSYITKDGREMGRAQVMQAEAAGIEPDVRMNPILLKPTTDSKSQVILEGKVYKDLSAKDYYKEKEDLLPKAVASFQSLAQDYDIIIMEGAGSPSEINLKDVDIVNMGFAKEVDAPAIVVGDIDRGGVFASLAGTLLLFDEEEKERTKGVLVNKFRGDVSILEPGLEMLEDIIQKPVLGVVPYIDIDIDDEDSLSEQLIQKKTGELIDIAVIRLPHISNFTDINVFGLYDGVEVRFVDKPKELGKPDLLIIPGTKNTMDDMRWLRESGLDGKIINYANKDGYVIGICGGYQILGQKLSDPFGVETGGEIQGLGLLPMKTIFSKEKTTKRTKAEILTDQGIFKYLKGAEVEGYEIHMGQSEVIGDPLLRVEDHKDGCVSGRVAGTYIHGFFDLEGVSQKVLHLLFEEKGLVGDQLEKISLEEYKENQYEKLADAVEEALDMDSIDKILGI